LRINNFVIEENEAKDNASNSKTKDLDPIETESMGQGTDKAIIVLFEVIVMVQNRGE